MPSYEEAQNCPKCSEHGQLGETRRNVKRQGDRVEAWYCRNERCTWNNTPWFVQINPDGTIPSYEESSKKERRQFPEMSPTVLARGQRNVEDAVNKDLGEERE